MSNERKFDEEKLLLYKENEDPILFEEILKNKDIKRYTLYVCNQKFKNFPSTLLSMEDFKNIADLILWKCILKYKFICPVCGITTKTQSMYKLHMTKHGEYQEPLVGISKYIKFNLGAYLQNELRKEYSIDRQSNISTTSLSPTSNVGENDYEINNTNSVEYEILGDYSIEDDYIFEDSMECLMKKFDPITKEIFYCMHKLNMKQVDIAIKLYNDGRYSSEQSAKVVISRIVKNKIRPVITEFYRKNI